MPNRWITFVKNWSAKNNVSYACALSMPELKDAYRKKHGIAKPLGKNVERGLMGAEDKDAPAPPKRSATPSVRQLDLVPLKDIMDKREKARENKEMESMGAEDRDVGKGGKYQSAFKKIKDLLNKEDYRENRDEIKAELQNLLDDYNNGKMSASIEKEYEDLVSKNNELYRKNKAEIDVRKKERKQSSKEREMMGAEDVNVGKSRLDEINDYIKELKSGKKINKKIIEKFGGLYKSNKLTKSEDDAVKTMIDLYNAPIRSKKESKEREMMGAEDINRAEKITKKPVATQKVFDTPVLKGMIDSYNKFDKKDVDEITDDLKNWYSFYIIMADYLTMDDILETKYKTKNDRKKIAKKAEEIGKILEVINSLLNDRLKWLSKKEGFEYDEDKTTYDDTDEIEDADFFNIIGWGEYASPKIADENFYEIKYNAVLNYFKLMEKMGVFEDEAIKVINSRAKKMGIDDTIQLKDKWYSKQKK